MEVRSSTLRGTTQEDKNLRAGGLAQLARAPALQAGGQRFESVILHCFVARIQRVKRVESVLFSTEEERTKVIFDILTNVKAITN